MSAPVLLRSRDFVGRDVVDREGEKLGDVAELLFDGTGRVSFLDVEFGLPRRHVLVPVGELDWGPDRFVLSRWTRDRARTLPHFDSSEPIRQEVLDELERAFPWFYTAEEAWITEPAGGAAIVPLSRAKDFRLEKGAPDLKGWTVFAGDGERVGTAEELLVDPNDMKVRYLSVDLLDDLYLLRDDRHVLVPLERVDIKERGNDVWIRSASAAEIARLPAYTGGTVHPAMERAVQKLFS